MSLHNAARPSVHMRALRENVGERCHTSFIYFAIDWGACQGISMASAAMAAGRAGCVGLFRFAERKAQRIFIALPEHRLRRDVAYVAPVLSLSAPLLFFLLKAGPLDNFIPCRHFAP